MTTDPLAHMPRPPIPAPGSIGGRRSLALALLLALVPWGVAFPETPADDAAKRADQTGSTQDQEKTATASQGSGEQEAEKKPAEKKATEKKGAAPAPPAQPARKPPAAPKTEPPPLRFTDDDLDRLHRRAPATDDEEGEAVEEPAGTSGQGAPPTAGMPAGKPRRATAPGAAGSKPPAAQPEPSLDLLQKFKDREAREVHRKSQIEGLRNRIAQIQSRIDYLKARKTAVLNPLVLPPAPQTDADRTGDAGLKPKELLAQIDQEIESLQEDIEEAQGSLVRLETAFAESGVR